jgi:hypothetical protein
MIFLGKVSHSTDLPPKLLVCHEGLWGQCLGHGRLVMNTHLIKQMKGNRSEEDRFPVLQCGDGAARK